MRNRKKVIGKTHLFIPDVQARPGVPLNHLDALGKYIVERQPEVIVCAGDFADMHSLGIYDKGKLKGEGARYEEDLAAAWEGMERLMTPIIKARGYSPELHLTLGNHEQRIDRYVNANPELAGAVGYHDLPYAKYGWNVHDFLEVVEIDNILYSHYFPRNAQGRVVQAKHGAPNARLQLQREMQSCTSGHLQGLDFAIHQTGTRRYYGVIAGSFYQHDEEYLSPQGNAYWRGVVVKHGVEAGEYNPMFVSLEYLLERYK